VDFYSPDMDSIYNIINDNNNIKIRMIGISVINSSISKYYLEAGAGISSKITQNVLNFDFIRRDGSYINTGIVSAPIWYDGISLKILKGEQSG
jgi:hypothetical protein